MTDTKTINRIANLLGDLMWDIDAWREAQNCAGYALGINEKPPIWDDLPGNVREFIRRETGEEAAHEADCLELARYWRDQSECTCDSPFPIGGCMRCDMQQIINNLTKNTNR